MLEILDFPLRSVGDGFCPKRSAGWQATPFARDVVFLDVSFHSIVVADFEGCNVGRGVEEERLAMASILGNPMLLYQLINIYLLP